MMIKPTATTMKIKQIIRHDNHHHRGVIANKDVIANRQHPPRRNNAPAKHQANPQSKLQAKLQAEHQIGHGTNQPPPQLVVRAGGYSVAGQEPTNQDAFAVKIPTNLNERKHKGVIATIADGVSASDVSQKASETSVTEFITDYLGTPATWPVKMAAEKVLTSLNNWLFHHVRQGNASSNAMVAAFSALVLKSHTAYIFHAGDCRVYLYRSQQLTQMTDDHRRYLSKSQHHLTRALGIDSHLEIDYQTLALARGDLFMMTTDGIHDALSATQIAALLAECIATTCGDENALNLEIAAKYIVNHALDAGSDGNATCLLLAVDALPPATFNESCRDREKRVIPPVLREGQRIDHYHIVRIIHSGSRSHLYLARSELDGKQYVLKMPSQNFADNAIYLCGFIREGWIGEQIHQRGVMKIHPPSVHSPFLYHVCDYVDGITFRQWMMDNPNPPLSDVRTLAKGAIRAMRVLQRMAVVHRDIKPDNFMVDGDLNVTLIDYGTVQAKGLDEISDHIKEDYPVGDLNYAAPEYLNGNIATLSSDVFSLAVTLYELLTDKLPFPAVNVANPSTSKRHNYTPITVFRPDIPEWFDAALKKACHPIASARYQVLSEFEQDLITANPTFTPSSYAAALIDKNPLRFWKGLSAILLLLLVVQLVLLTEVK